MTSRRLLSLALATGVAATLAVGGTAAAATAATAPLQLTLPVPTGPDPVGTVALHLIQADRPDPFAPGRPRELMVSLTYPARHADRYPVAPYMPAGTWASFKKNLDIPAGAIVPATAAHDGAPVARHPGGLPVVLYSPPGSGDREVNTVLVQELASRGYVVATIDHTYTDNEVEFPDGRVVQRVLPAVDDETTQQFTDEVAERDKDARFVLDELTAIEHGHNPDVDHHGLPNGLRGSLDLDRVGMFGFSLGGATSAATMLDDGRIKAGIDMDGTLFGPVVTAGLTRPFMLLTHPGNARDTDPSWGSFWNASTGWKRDFQLQGSQHRSYSDLEALLPPIGLPPDQLERIIGTIDPQRAFTIETAYVTSFFDRHLRHRDNHLLDGQSTQFPEMLFQP
jgi:hypothetical protein